MSRHNGDTPMGPARSLYEVLGVSPDATGDEIRAAFQKKRRGFTRTRPPATRWLTLPEAVGSR